MAAIGHPVGRLAGFCLAVSITLGVFDARADSGPRLGTWYLVGRDTTYWRAEMVIERNDGQGYAGKLTWRAVGGEPAGGIEPFHAEYDPATQTFRMRGGAVQEATGNIASGAHYQARVTCDGRYLVHGHWWGDGIEDGTWTARHQTGEIGK
jgi:hypothetical protein